MFGGYGLGSKFHIKCESTWASLGFLIEICGIDGKGKP